MARLPGALFLCVLLASTTLAENQPAQKVITNEAPSLSMQMVAPLFHEDAEFTAGTVTLVHDTIQALTARMLVLGPHGVATQKEFKLPGHTSVLVRIDDSLDKSRSAVTTGSVNRFQAFIHATNCVSRNQSEVSNDPQR